MGTRFELLLADPRRGEMDLRAVGELVLDAIEDADRRLSAFRRDSVIARINRHAAHEPVRVDREAFRLLERCVALHAMTRGAFDPTVAPWLRLHGLRGAVPAGLEVETALAACGAEKLELDAARSTVRFHHPAMELDLGAVGKGYALDVAHELLDEYEIENAFLHGGTSSLLARGRPPGRLAWTVAVTIPARDPGCEPATARIDLHDQCLAVSAPHGRMVSSGDATIGHVIDPRDGRAVSGIRVAGCVSRSALEADAWATAWLVLGSDCEDDALPVFAQNEGQAAFLYRAGKTCPRRFGVASVGWELPDPTP